MTFQPLLCLRGRDDVKGAIHSPVRTKQATLLQSPQSQIGRYLRDRGVQGCPSQLYIIRKSSLSVLSNTGATSHAWLWST